MSTTRTMTEADLMALPRDGYKREYVDGEIRVSPAGFRHGNVALRLGGLLIAYVEAHGLGYAADSSTGFWMPSGNLRLPDLSFVSTARMPDGPPTGFSRIVPDLAVEILSPGDRHREVLDKVGEYVTSGVRLVWIIDPDARRAAVHRSLVDVTTLCEDDELDGLDVVPGFRCKLATIFG